MQNETIDWQDVQFFLEAARAGSARATAQSLGLSHTTVARRIDNLEKVLGTRLFDRYVSGYSLTEEGNEMIQYAEQVEEAMIGAARQLQGKDKELSGQIRVTTPDVIATEILIPNLHLFNNQYPGIEIEVVSSSQILSIEQLESDIAIRIMGYGHQPPDPLVGRKLGRIGSCFYATPEYIKKHRIEDPDTTACWLGWGDDQKYPEWVRKSPYPFIPRRHNLNAAMLQKEAVKNGLGMAMLPCFVADNIEGIKRLPKCSPATNHELWLLSHPSHRDVARLRVFREFAVDLFKKNADRMLGF